MSDAYRVPPPEEGDQALVKVASYSSAVEAEMARVLLQDNGIIAFSREAASFNPLVSLIAGGAFVEVRARDETRARALLARLERTPTDDGHDGDDEVRCPRCELSYCFHETALGNASASGMQVGPLIALVLLPFGFGRKRWHCRKCLHVWDDPAAGPTRMTPLGEDDPRPVFRLRRRRTGSGLVLGLALGLLLGLMVKDAGAPGPIVLVLVLVAPLAGYVIGHRSITDVCSAPTCRATLPRGADDCPLCRGAIAGVITAASEHYAEAAQFRRELAGLAAADEIKALPPKPVARKKKRRAPPSEPRATS